MLHEDITILDCEGPNKIISLSEAVQQLIKPNTTLHFGFTHYRANAVAFEIVRQYYGKLARFSLIGAGMLEYAVALVGAGLVNKMVAGFFGDTFPGPAPSKIFQKFYKEGIVEFECWTNLTICLGLLAGALNIEFIPTNSLMGSSLIDENVQSMKVIESPFSGDRSAIVRALKPDITIIHGLAADPFGNTIFSPPYGEALWGAFASRQGVMVTVEKIVSTEEIRKYSNFVKLPGHIVRSVSEVPFGAHPQGMSNHGLQELCEGYAEDYSFREEFRNGARDEESFQQWLKEWIVPFDHDGYLAKLGKERLACLKKRVASEFREVMQPDRRPESMNYKERHGWSGTETMIVAAADLIAQEMERGNYRTLLAGIGVSHLASWLAKARTNSRCFELLTETGFYGYRPTPGDPFIFNLANVPTCKMQSDFIQILGVIVGSRQTECLAVLSAGEIDKRGNINSTKKPEEGLFLVGGGGSNDVASGAARIIALTKQSPQRLVEKVSFITCPGDKIKYLVTDKAIMQKDDMGEFVLTGCLTNEKPIPLQQRIDEVRLRCGWDLKVAPNPVEVPPPTERDLQVLRLFDPERWFLA
jgi:acyl CoA:acetate/3-ketoacid CoA transferase alpha subunit/acyl CoA:acetate/3-ketoacid CoA transferase beta subunit